MLIVLNHSRHVIPNTTLASLVQTARANHIKCTILHFCVWIMQRHPAPPQKLINFSVHVTSGRRRHDHISDVVQRLGWMNAVQLVEYHTVGAVQSAVKTGLPERVRCTIGLPANQRRFVVHRMGRPGSR